jgi:DNA modification methylase
MSLWTELIKAFSSKNTNNIYDGRILDIYHGSGTTGACCERLNNLYNHQIKWMGIELESKWVEISNKRIEHERTRPKSIDIFE